MARDGLLRPALSDFQDREERRKTVESKPAFKPVTMTLESLEEVEHLTHALRLYEEFHAENSPEARFAREVLAGLGRQLGQS